MKKPRLTPKQKEIIQIMTDNPTYYILASDYQHGQDLTDGIPYDGDNKPFRKYFYLSTLNRLIETGYIKKDIGNKYILA